MFLIIKVANTVTILEVCIVKSVTMCGLDWDN